LQAITVNSVPENYEQNGFLVAPRPQCAMSPVSAKARIYVPRITLKACGMSGKTKNPSNKSKGFKNLD